MQKHPHPSLGELELSQRSPKITEPTRVNFQSQWSRLPQNGSSKPSYPPSTPAGTAILRYRGRNRSRNLHFLSQSLPSTSTLSLPSFCFRTSASNAGLEPHASDLLLEYQHGPAPISDIRLFWNSLALRGKPQLARLRERSIMAPYMNTASVDRARVRPVPRMYIPHTSTLPTSASQTSD